MTSPPFKIGDRVVCVDDRDTSLHTFGVYRVYAVSMTLGECFISVSAVDTDCRYAASRFTIDKPAPAPDDYPDSVEDYSHNKPHVVIAWGAVGLLMWLMFFAGLWLGWLLL